ncbi:hypothetical protein G7Z17_g8391 [Cylindrodendrum hubeiense]|uniref:Myb-like domain-containing protein n=1 Tax=Cylindrodendrum hubeiense TaxID=595255 RepID=A0A9P5H3Q1_9HYPO|nr:hypothetical protein G7Z17_g8391 [Cylindrodendrum hubeiense]
MSDTEKGEGKVLPWTEEAKYQFLLRIVAQFKEDGKQINWSRVVMPGRTTKSLQNMWTKINKAVSDLEDKNGTGESEVTTTPAKKVATPRKPRAKKAPVPTEDGDDSDANPMSAKKATPRKRAATGTPKRQTKAKKDQDDDDISASIKAEVDGDEGQDCV